MNHNFLEEKKSKILSEEYKIKHIFHKGVLQEQKKESAFELFQQKFHFASFKIQVDFFWNYPLGNPIQLINQSYKSINREANKSYFSQGIQKLWKIDQTWVKCNSEKGYWKKYLWRY